MDPARQFSVTTIVIVDKGYETDAYSHALHAHSKGA